MPETAAGEEDGHVRGRVGVGVAEVGAVEHHGAVEQTSSRLRAPLSRPSNSSASSLMCHSSMTLSCESFSSDFP